MYGTTIRNYNNYTRTTRTDDINKSFFAKNKKTRKAKKEDFHKTRYMRIEENNEVKETNSDTFVNETKVSRKEFPIASVILTVVATMIFMLIGTGVIG
jgi:hypothetical protein